LKHQPDPTTPLEQLYPLWRCNLDHSGWNHSCRRSLQSSQVCTRSQFRNTAVAYSVLARACQVTARAVVGGVTAVTVHSSPASITGEAGAIPSHTAVANPILAGASVAADTVVGGVTVVAVHSSPANVTGEASAIPGHAAVANPILADARSTAASIVVGGVTAVAVHSSPAKITGSAGALLHIPHTVLAGLGGTVAELGTLARGGHTNGGGNIGSALPLTWLAGEFVVRRAEFSQLENCCTKSRIN